MANAKIIPPIFSMDEYELLLENIPRDGFNWDEERSRMLVEQIKSFRLREEFKWKHFHHGRKFGKTTIMTVVNEMESSRLQKETEERELREDLEAIILEEERLGNSEYGMW